VGFGNYLGTLAPSSPAAIRFVAPDYPCVARRGE
jgi:hypothetical protein